MDKKMASAGVVSLCRLCSQERQLQESHVVSAFVYRWFKRGMDRRGSPMVMHDYGTSETSLVQDGLKPKLLCWDCEQRISPWEREFQSRFFAPFHDKPGEPRPYHRWCALFGASIAWRVLVHNLERTDVQWPKGLREEAMAAAGHWREFLLSDVTGLGRNRLHLVPISQDAAPTAPLYTNKTLETLLCVHRVTGDHFVFVKLGALLLIAVIRDSSPRLWKFTNIEVGGGVWNQRGKFATPTTVRQYIQQRAEETRRRFSSPRPQLSRPRK